MALGDWKANGQGVGSELLDALNRLAQTQATVDNEYKRMLDELLGVSGQPRTSTQPGASFNTHPPKWSNIAEMNAALAAKKKAQANRAPPKPIDKAARIKTIEDELDIIRGRVPTPKGFKVDASRVKDLMLELKQLQK